MSSARESEVGPKARTRRLLIEAAHELLRTGRPLTVAAAAEVAGVSRATAYRYFMSNEAVILHASLPLAEDPRHDAQAAARPTQSDPDLPSRAATLVRQMGEWAFDHETELRTLLRLSLDPERADKTPRREQTSRATWIADLLQGLPADVPTADRERLAASLTALFGADAVVWTTDMANLDRNDALDTLSWMARTLVEATLSPNHR